MTVAGNILDLIGNTPMVRINKLVGPGAARLLAKLEWFNIGGSVKDRTALFLLNSAEAAGRLDKSRRILEATSGNTGIALAMISALKGYGLTIVLPESTSIERRKMIRAYGAELIMSPAKEGTAGARRLKQTMIQESPEKYFDIDQFSDPANIQAHYETTGQEILAQAGELDMVVVSIGTAGTGVGISKAVKERNSGIRVVGVTPALDTSIQGLRNPNGPDPTQLFKRSYFDEIVEIREDDMDRIFNIARRAAREEGLFIGMSSAASLYVAIMKANELGRGKTVVTIFPDNGDKYLSTNLFE